MSEYSEKLKDPRWQKKRLEIFERDEWTCFSCKSKVDSLHVHHKKYKIGRDPWEYNDSNFITLCHRCHDIKHKYKFGNVKLYQKGGCNGFSYDGHCPQCNSKNIREKGSFDSCNECGLRIGTHLFYES